ncbi:4Fe-4S binding protein, partial [bacterium]|nr:4Fe-4S binding protein [bacterium]
MPAGAAPPSPPPVARKNRYARWRAATLALVYVLFVVHIVHWRLAGRTLAPLELNEVMYTFELGIVTAGFLFMVAAFTATAFFGRFFCSWGCHILALQDLSAWILARLRIKARPVRSRVLMLVPPLALFYMFVWPQLSRAAVHFRPSLASTLGTPPPFDLRIAGDAEGWASFVTTDFWRNLPGPWTAALTFLVCGFAIVYFLGTRAFCRYGCPYGVLFALGDRAARGRIRLTGNCTGCGLCSAGCQSGIRVHEEIARFGTVVSASCLKDLDCIGRCPEQAITYGWGPPAGLRSLRDPDRVRRRGHFTTAEEIILAVSFVATLLVFRGLYAAVPFLLTLGLGGVVGFVGVMALRLFRQRTVSWRGVLLRAEGRWTAPGYAFGAGAALLAAFVVHSAFIRYHETRGDAALYLADALADGSARVTAERDALRHLLATERWGLVRPSSLEPKLASLHLALGNTEPARASLERIVRRSRNAAVRAGAHVRLAGLHRDAGETTAAEDELRAGSV